MMNDLERTALDAVDVRIGELRRLAKVLRLAGDRCAQVPGAPADAVTHCEHAVDDLANKLERELAELPLADDGPAGDRAHGGGVCDGPERKNGASDRFADN